MFCINNPGSEGTQGHPVLILILLTSKTLTVVLGQHQAIKTTFTCLNLSPTLTLVDVRKTNSLQGEKGKLEMWSDQWKAFLKFSMASSPLLRLDPSLAHTHQHTPHLSPDTLSFYSQTCQTLDLRLSWTSTFKFLTFYFVLFYNSKGSDEPVAVTPGEMCAHSGGALCHLIVLFRPTINKWASRWEHFNSL